MTNQKIGLFIAALRKQRGLTQEQLAEKLGVTNRSVSRWENGNTLPDFSLMQELSHVLSVSMSELLTGQRSSKEDRLEDCITLAMELAQREKEHQCKTLNLHFGCGFALLMIAILHNSLGLLSFIPQPSRAAALWLCIGLGFAFTLTGFYRNNKIRPISKSEITVLTTAESELHMKTAAEMRQFARKYQNSQRKQHCLAFEELERQLSEDEFAIFTFIGDSCTINDSPGPWHIATAVTNKRFLLSGEIMRGCMLPTFTTASHEREALKAIELQGSKLMLHFDDTVIKIDGSNFGAIIEKLQHCL